MISSESVPPVVSDELLARYVLQSSQIRSSDMTIKPDAFIPYRLRELSVTRHRDATVAEIWNCGQLVAMQTSKTLYGRADLVAKECLTRQLTIEAAPLPENPNHANICGWPADKPSQKMIAIELAAAAKYIPLT